MLSLEAALILGQRPNVTAKRFELSDICFPEQLAFIKDDRPWVMADCSRRAGKTEVCAYDLLHTAITCSNVTCLYITLTRSNAERIVWAKLLEINASYSLGGDVNRSKLSLTFSNGSVIYLSGCNDKSELDKFRGLALKLVYIDEVQSFKSFIRELVDEVLSPALLDHAGKLKFIGTPGPIQTGFFWDLKTNPEYSHHHWTFWQNPFIPIKAGMTHQELFTRELKRRGVSQDHPSIRREFFGEWTTDTESLVFQYNGHRNHFDQTHDLTDYVIGLDFGTDDADAIAVLGWNKYRRECYLVEEYIQNGLTVTEVAAEVQKRIQKYNPLKVVADTGANGKKIALEISKRTGVPIHAAEKARKIEHITWLNDAFRTSLFFARRTSRFAQDCSIVEWDYDKSTSDRLVIKDEPHSDICDAVLYAYVEALHWLTEPKPEKVNLKEQWAKYSRQMADDAIENRIRQQQAEETEQAFFETAGSLDDDLNVLKSYVNRRR
jgi:hypothetical protein